MRGGALGARAGGRHSDLGFYGQPSTEEPRLGGKDLILGLVGNMDGEPGASPESEEVLKTE